MKIYIETYKGWDIYFCQNTDLTVSDCHWIVSNGYITYWLYYSSLSEIKKFIDSLEISNENMRKED